MTMPKNIKQTEDNLNRLVSEGWTLQPVVNALDGMIGFFYKEEN